MIAYLADAQSTSNSLAGPLLWGFCLFILVLAIGGIRGGG